MKKKVNLLFAIHCHQPVGNFESVIEDAYNKAYKPFIAVMERHPGIKFTAHYSGILLEWFYEKHPEFLARLKKLVDKGQLEIMTGGFYEPVMAVIPDRDKKGQIEKQTSFLSKYLDANARGMWLAERIWEPHLPKPLFESGVEYTVLDDYHFISAGLKEEDLHGYFITEEQGFPLYLFPTSKKLRYLIPFRPAEETVDYLRGLATEDGSVAAVIADDGEKFGVWPGTEKWVYEDGYLEKLLTMIENDDIIETMTFSEYIDEFQPRGRIYLPAASYFEMMEWALPNEASDKFDKIKSELKNAGKLCEYQRFFKGGFWRNFFVKYPESNNMHKKMMLVSEKASLIEKNYKLPLSDMFDELWKGQCNCAYWHGVFGGLYLNYLRHAVYEHLIRAENLADKVLHKADRWIEVEVQDLDSDGNPEVIVNTSDISLYVSPEMGGCVFELDFRPKCFNLMNNMSRHEEPYHRNIIKSQMHQLMLTDDAGTSSIHDSVRVKEYGLTKYLTYDTYRRTSFIDHFLAEGTDLESFSKNVYEEAGDFIEKPYEHEEIYGKEKVSIIMSRKGTVGTGGRDAAVKVNKRIDISAESNTFEVSWAVENESGRDIDLWMGVELNFSLLAGSSPDRYYVIDGKRPENSALASKGESQGVYEVNLVDKWSGTIIIIETSKRVDLWRFPVETVSQSEGGFERTYQGSAMLLNWKFTTARDSEEKFSLKITIKEDTN